MQALANGASRANDGVGVEEDSVDKSQDEYFVSNLIVSPTALTAPQDSEVLIFVI
jgi:hypothetical protein